MTGGGTHTVNRDLAGHHLSYLIGQLGAEAVAKSMNVQPATVRRWSYDFVPMNRCAEIHRMHQERLGAESTKS